MWTEWEFDVSVSCSGRDKTYVRAEVPKRMEVVFRQTAVASMPPNGSYSAGMFSYDSRRCSNPARLGGTSGSMPIAARTSSGNFAGWAVSTETSRGSVGLGGPTLRRPTRGSAATLESAPRRYCSTAAQPTTPCGSRIALRRWYALLIVARVTSEFAEVGVDSSRFAT